LKANNALVFMWQSFGENVAQLIAVFTSHGPIKGIIDKHYII